MSKSQAIWGTIILMIVSIITLIAVTQLDQIRQFFSRAGGENANIMIDTTAIIGPMPRPWRYLAQGGESHAWQLAPLKGQVAALKPQYIRIDHLYDFYDIVGGSSGNLTFDFSKLDPLLDDIVSTGAKPYIALSYMPPVISSGDIVAPPANYNDWQLVVQKTVEHISGTKGISDVYYEVWNEPDLFGGWKYYGERSYLTLYNSAVKGANNARGVRPFKIGGPATTANYKNWFEAMAKNAIENNVRWDFYSWHRYSLDVDQYRQDMADAKDWLRQYPQLEPTLELHITEWGHDSNNNKGYDSAFGAAHSVAAAIEMVGVVDKAFVFEIQDGSDPAGQEYWGRWGLFTAGDKGAKAKPRYFGLKMLDRIANQRLQLLGKGSWVKGLAAKNDNGTVELILANYDKKGQHSELVPVTYQNIEPGSYVVKTQFLNGQQKSERVATSAAVLQTNVMMGINSVAFVELTKEP